MDIRGIDYNWRIFPRWGKVQAEIYYIQRDVEMKAIVKEFGSSWSLPKENDYEAARKWIDMQMKSMYHANKDL